MNLITDFITNNAICISAIILIISYIFIAIEKIPKVTIALIGATITIILGLLGQEKFVNGHLVEHYFINYVDFNVVFLLVSMMIIVNISAKTGIFNWLANEMLKKTNGQPKKILITLALFTAVVSAFLDNVTTVILIMPITFVIAKELDLDPRPFLITEILTSNIGGTATLIGDPPNIIIGSVAGFSFLDFVKELTGVVFVILAVIICLLTFVFRKKLITTDEKMKRIKDLDNTNTITDKVSAIRSMIVL